MSDTAVGPDRPRAVRVPVPTVIGTRHVRRDHLLRRLLAVSDLVAISLAYAVTLLLYHESQFAIYALWAVPTLPAWIVLLKAYGLYDRDIKRVSHCTVDDVPWLAHALLLGGLGTWGWFRLLPLHKLQFDEILTIGLIAALGILLLRSTARHLAARLLGAERVLMVGGGAAAALLVGKMRAHPEYRLQPVGVVLEPDAEHDEDLGLPVMGRLDSLDLIALASNERIERIVISALDSEALLDVVRVCKPLALKVSILPPLSGAMGPSMEIDDVEGVTVLGINPPILGRSSRMLKRSLDLAGASLLLILSAPMMAASALAIRLSSPGPILFRQERVGKDGRSFVLLKFRSMIVGAEARRAELVQLSKDSGWLHIDHDPRVTRVGRVLRRWSLDELPQLWNVLRGDMSLVGPRPLIAAEDEHVDGWARSRLDLTPGITGLWQVLGRTNIPFEEMVKLDYLYVTNWSLWNDVRLMLRTLPVVVGRRGVN